MTVDLSPENISEEEQFAQVKTESERNWKRGEEQWGPAWQLMERDLRGYAGSTWTHQELNQLSSEHREAIELPLIRSKINWFTGFQRDNIKSLEVQPVEGADQQTADQLSKTTKQVWDRGQGQYHLNQAFEDAVKTGISLLGMFLDFSKDPVNGDIKFFRRTYNSFVLDPDFEQPDLSDCSWAMLRDFVTRDQAKELLPFIDEDVIDNVPSAQRDDKFIHLRPFARNFNNPDIITYDQYYRRISEKRKLLIDKDSGFSRDITDMEKEKLEKLEEGITALGATEEANVEIREETKEVVELSILLSGQVVFSGKDALGLENHYPFVPIFCFFEPGIEQMEWRFQGIVRGMYDAQRIFNKRNMKVLDIMDKVIYGSTKYKLGAVDDPSSLMQSGTRRIIGIQPEFNIDDVQDMQANTTGIAEIVNYSQVVDQLFNELSGINDTLLGADEGGNTEISGRLAQVRTANGVRANRKIFDQLDFSHKLLGNLMLEAIQKNYTPEKIQLMINEEPTQQFFDKQFQRFDAVIKQGVESATQKDQYYFELVNLKREGIVDVPQAEIIRALPLTGKTNLLEAVQKQEEEQKEQQKEQQELEQVQKDLVNAQIEQSLALAQERRGRVVSDIGLAKERASEAEENRSKAALDRAKTMVEIQNLEQDQLIKVLNFMRQLQAQENQELEQKEADITQESLAAVRDVDSSFEQNQKQQQAEASIDSLMEQVTGGDQSGGV